MRPANESFLVHGEMRNGDVEEINGEMDSGSVRAAAITTRKAAAPGFCISREVRERVGCKSISGTTTMATIATMTTSHTTLAQQPNCDLLLNFSSAVSAIVKFRSAGEISCYSWYFMAIRLAINTLQKS
jgi:hypothetical protein